MSALLSEVIAEMGVGERKFGPQYGLADGSGDQVTFLPGTHIPRGVVPETTLGTLCYLQRAQTDRRAGRGCVTWADILLEETFEACSEDDPAELRAELIQVAAVALRWIDALDHRKVAS